MSVVRDHTASLSKEVPDPLARIWKGSFKKELKAKDKEDRG